MTAPSNIQKNVMRRVRFIRAVRPFSSAAAGAAYLLVVSLYLIGRDVFVAQVFRNAPHTANVAAVLRFFEAAFLNTTFAVQALSVLTLLAVLWLAHEIIRALAAPHHRFA